MENKLKKRSEYLKVQKEGYKEWPTKWLLLNYKPSTSGNLRFGATVSKKVGSAVMRNKLKRWNREYFRSILSENSEKQVDINVVFKPMPEDFYKNLNYSEFKQAMDVGIRRVFRITK